MPETAVHKHSKAVLRKHEVGPTRKIVAVNSEAEPHPMRHAPNASLRPGVLRSDGSHVGRTAGINRAFHSPPE